MSLTPQALSEAMAKAQLADFVKNQRAAYLSRMASATMAHLTVVCNTEADAMTVLTSVLGLLAARGDHSLEDVHKLVDGAFDDQKKQLAKARLVQAPT